ncbi:MAG: non-reducing end alpha-L-arabinofuranosidase family hydrolase [Verrucomicrobia bacterium]|nr:non-reducing end alpha-L-arabinofuranosidase family hydrolase [Verrucomicrobiota bacterium]
MKTMATIIGAVMMTCASGADSTLGKSQTSVPSAIAVPAIWEYTAPLITPETRDKDVSVSQKDPTVVCHEGRWHVFMTVKLADRTGIEYCGFDQWKAADKAPRTILKISDSRYYCAPQVFYFTPHKKWYLVFQMGVPDAKKMWVAYSTTATITDPKSWTQAQPILDGGASDPRQEGGLDYWIICDEQWANLFFTSLNGKMWRMRTKLEDFPKGFDHCEIALQASIFEASHTYKLKGTGKYLTMVEENGRRFYKAYLADRLDGPWTPLADTAQRPFAGWTNIRPTQGVEPWTDNVSHGELIREGNDQTMAVTPGNLRFVFQGMLDKEKAGKGYGQFPWRIGILSSAEKAQP